MSTAIEPSRCTGIVLAGGRSSRMGRDKALLAWRGRPLLEHQIDTLRAAGIHTVHVSGDRPDYQGIADTTPHAGPLGGLAGIAARLPDTQLIVIPVDMPHLDATLLKRLCDARAETGCVRFAERVLPMRLRLDTTTRGALAALMAADHDRARSVRALQIRVGITELAVTGAEGVQFTDCNTPTQWQEATA